MNYNRPQVITAPLRSNDIAKYQVHSSMGGPAHVTPPSESRIMSNMVYPQSMYQMGSPEFAPYGNYGPPPFYYSPVQTVPSQFNSSTTVTPDHLPTPMKTDIHSTSQVAPVYPQGQYQYQYPVQGTQYYQQMAPIGDKSSAPTAPTSAIGSPIVPNTPGPVPQGFSPYGPAPYAYNAWTYYPAPPMGSQSSTYHPAQVTQLAASSGPGINTFQQYSSAPHENQNAPPGLEQKPVYYQDGPQGPISQ
jgi:hypothetical protein